jgi:hypothetical protein
VPTSPTGSAYSPQRRTAIVFTGTGIAGAYHAGVMKALREAGIRIDVVAGHGMGAITALFSAVDADARLWDAAGLWRDARALRALYPWRATWAWLAWGTALALALLLLPLGLALVAAAAYPLVYLVALVSPAAGSQVAETYAHWVGRLLSPDVLLTLVPRASTAALIVTAFTLLAATAAALVQRRLGGSRTGRAWWNILGAPLDADRAVRWATAGFWQFLRGAASVAEPSRADLSQRYGELLGENLGQPGYRELILVAHDLDARRDLVFAAVAAAHREAFVGGTRPSPQRAPDVVDLVGAGRAHVFDAVGGCLSIAAVSDAATITFAADAFWRGETHRLADRPAAVGRVLEEVARAGVTQVILVSAAASVDTAHALVPVRTDPRGRLAEALVAAERAAIRDAIVAHEARFAAIVEVHPQHQPLLPFDVDGAWDARSDRRHVLDETIAAGYEDAYRQFIEPVVGAGGDAMTAAPARRSGDDLPLRG